MLKKFSYLIFAIVVVYAVSLIYYERPYDAFIKSKTATPFTSDKNAQTITPTSTKSSTPTLNYIFIGDTGTGYDNQYDVAKSIEKYCSLADCKAIFIPGDVIYEKGVKSVDDDDFNSKFEKPYADIDMPFYIAYGNHDYLGCKDCYIKYTQNSKKWRMPSQYYTIREDEVEFFVINTEDFSDEQAKWLEDSIDNSNAKYKIVTGHRPIVTYESAHQGEKWKGKEKLKDVICNKADYIAGHSHVLEYPGELKGCSARQFISGAGGTLPRTIVKDHKDLFYYEGNGFLSVSIGEKMNFDFYNTKMEKMYSVGN